MFNLYVTKLKVKINRRIKDHLCEFHKLIFIQDKIRLQLNKIKICMTGVILNINSIQNSNSFFVFNNHDVKFKVNPYIFFNKCIVRKLMGNYNYMIHMISTKTVIYKINLYIRHLKYV
jgi:hypothetical protein